MKVVLDCCNGCILNVKYFIGVHHEIIEKLKKFIRRQFLNFKILKVASGCSSGYEHFFKLLSILPYVLKLIT